MQTPMTLGYTSLSFSIANILTTTPTVTFVLSSKFSQTKCRYGNGGVVSTSGYAP